MADFMYITHPDIPDSLGGPISRSSFVNHFSKKGWVEIDRPTEEVKAPAGEVEADDEDEIDEDENLDPDDPADPDN